MDDAGDRSESGGGVGKGGHRGVVGDIGGLCGHLVAFAAELLGHRLESGLVVVGEQQAAADRGTATDRDADAPGADEHSNF